MAERELRRADRRVHVTPKAFELLVLLARASPAVVTKPEIRRTLWPDAVVAESNLPALVRELRMALADDARAPRFLRTAHRIGYALEGLSTAAVRGPTLAIVPFDGSADGLLRDSLGELLALELGRRYGIRVVARSTVARLWQGRSPSPRELLRQIGVPLGLAGTVCDVDGQLTAAVELLESDETLLASARTAFTAPEIARAAGTLVDTVGPDVPGAALRPVARRHGAVSRPFLEARYHFHRRTLTSLRLVEDLLKDPFGQPPEDADSLALIAAAWVALGSRGLAPVATCRLAAQAAARQALALDADHVHALTALGGALELFEWQWAEARAAFERALALDPLSVEAWHWFALHLARRGQATEARQAMTRVREVEPAAALSVIVAVNAALVAGLGGDPATCVLEAEHALRLDPFAMEAHLIAGLGRERLGDWPVARMHLRRAVELAPGTPYVVAASAALDAVAGERESARAQLFALDRQGADPQLRAVVRAALGEWDRAAECAEQALADRSPWLVYAATDPRLSGLRGHPRFQRVLRAVGLPPGE